jgi:hypothetical protein
MKKRGIFPILFGIIIYLARYIPIFHYQTLLIDKWYSIVDYAGACDSLVSIVLENCNMIETLNIAMIVVSVLFLVYGLFRLFKK